MICFPCSSVPYLIFLHPLHYICQAIQIISWLAKYKATSLKKYKLVTPILQVMCPLLAESTERDEDDDLASDRAAAEVIDTMALNLSKFVLPPVFEFASVNSQNANPKFREASVTALGVISEGCMEWMKNKLDSVLHIVLGALRDPEQMVRGAAAFALGQFAEHLQPEIISHYESVLPCILNALEDASDEVKVYYLRKEDNIKMNSCFLFSLKWIFSSNRKSLTMLWQHSVRKWVKRFFLSWIL